MINFSSGVVVETSASSNPLLIINEGILPVPNHHYIEGSCIAVVNVCVIIRYGAKSFIW